MVPEIESMALSKLDQLSTNESHSQPLLNSSKETVTGLHRPINIELSLYRKKLLEY